MPTPEVTGSPSWARGLKNRVQLRATRRTPFRRAGAVTRASGPHEPFEFIGHLSEASEDHRIVELTGNRVSCA